MFWQPQTDNNRARSFSIKAREDFLEKFKLRLLIVMEPLFLRSLLCVDGRLLHTRSRLKKKSTTTNPHVIVKSPRVQKTSFNVRTPTHVRHFQRNTSARHTFYFYLRRSHREAGTKDGDDEKSLVGKSYFLLRTSGRGRMHAALIVVGSIRLKNDFIFPLASHIAKTLLSWKR